MPSVANGVALDPGVVLRETWPLADAAGSTLTGGEEVRVGNVLCAGR
ncbi:MAG: hypothetical protein ACYSUI_00455 [Planctomycetota bacterium]|jgi:hypothetical protein